MLVHIGRTFPFVLNGSHYGRLNNITPTVKLQFMPITRVCLHDYFTKKIKRIRTIDEVAKENNLLFTKSDAAAGNLIALDSKEKKLLFFRHTRQLPSCLIIDLKSLCGCSMVRQYRSIKPGGLLKKNLQDYLTAISLCLRFKNRNRPVRLPFYEARRHKEQDTGQTERRARNWEAIIANLAAENRPVV